MQDALFPFTDFGQLINHTAADRTLGASAGAGGALDVSVLVEDDAGVRKTAIGAVGEGVERRFAPSAAPGRRQLEDDTASAANLAAARIDAAEMCRAVDIPCTVEDEAAVRSAAVRAAGKGVEHFFDCVSARSTRGCRMRERKR